MTGAGGEQDRRAGLEPLPATSRVVAELDVLSSDDDLLDQLLVVGRAVRRVVPTCRGLSLALVEQGVTLTLVASDEDALALDAVQYLDERGWHLFAAASAARGVASSLSLPVLREGVVVGSVNLYAATARAFDGHHHELVDLLGAWAGGAVTKADLSLQ